MQTAYIDPLSKAFDRMKQALFKPFSMSKWFVVGFTAFLSGMLSGGSFNFPGGSNRTAERNNVNFPDIEQIPRKILEWIHAHPAFFILILFAIVVVIVILLVLTWLYSRGAFMFLDNVAGNRAQVAAPWRQYKMQGNSLFLWHIGYGLICLLLAVPYIAAAFIIFRGTMHGGGAGKHLAPLIIFIAATLLLALIAIYISLFTNNFVVPLMYKYNLKAMEAWKLFLPLLTSHFWSFIFYGLFLLLLVLGTLVAFAIAGCLTCCILILVMLIPYINSVVSLPITYTYRAFSLEFLAQFGPEYSVFPIPELPIMDPPVPDPVDPSILEESKIG
jgi:hypothetical protein